MMKFIEAVQSDDGGTVRLVFQASRHVYAVVKLFDRESTSGRPVTVKLWDLTHSSLQKTKSFWSTKKPYTATTKDVAHARDVVSSLLNQISSN